MLRRNRFSYLLLLFLSLSVVVPTAHAGFGEYLGDSGGKLLRGAGHMVASPFELWCQTSKEMYARSPHTGFAVGLAKGGLHFAKRFALGAGEAVTFFLPSMGPSQQNLCYGYGEYVEDIKAEKKALAEKKTA